MTNITANALMNLKEQPQTLYVHGSIMTYRGDDKVVVTKMMDGINPTILLVDVKVIEGTGPMKGTPKHFNYELSDKTATKYKQVTIHHSEEETLTIDIIVLG